MVKTVAEEVDFGKPNVLISYSDEEYKKGQPINFSRFGGVIGW